MRAKATAAGAATVIRRHLRTVPVSAAAEVRAAARVEVRAGAVHGVHSDRARVSVREAERVIARARAGAAIVTVTHRAKVTLAVRGASIRRALVAETIRRYRNRAKAQVDRVRASISTRRLLARK